MWPNNGFGNGQFPNGFNNQAGFTNVGLGPGQQYGGSQFFPEQDMTMYDDFSGNGETEPEVGLYNHGAYTGNQALNADMGNGARNLLPSQLKNPPSLSSRAAALKAKLLKNRKGRSSPSNPTAVTLAVKQTHTGDDPPKTPIVPRHEQEANVSELIAQYSDQKADAKIKQDTKNITSSTGPATTDLQQIPAHPMPAAKSQVSSLGSPTKVLHSMGNGTLKADNTNGKVLGSRQSSNPLSEISDGEIFDDTPSTNQVLLATKTPVSKAGPTVDVQSRRTQEEQTKANSSHGQGAEPPPRRAPPVNTRKPLQSTREARAKENSHPDKRTRQQDAKSEEGPYSMQKRSTSQRRGSRSEELQRGQEASNPNERELNKQAQMQPRATLENLLLQDHDLREWLDITGYHNTPYRSKILNRRRAIAALDAQREKLVAEMAAEERGQTSSSTMLPPQLPNKIAGQAVQAPKANTEKDRAASNKRPYSDIQDSGNHLSIGKVARTDDPKPRVLESERPNDPRDQGNGEPRRSNDFGPSRRDFSPARRANRDHFRERFDDRSRSREREISPGRRACDGRRPTRGSHYGSDLGRDRDDIRERGNSRDTRPPRVIVGNYRGRAYDPNFKSRGGRGGFGRGLGDAHGSHDMHGFHGRPDLKNDAPYGSRIADNAPFRDTGNDKGAKGDTRYFIMRSFNEENILNCMRDGVWITQKENGGRLIEALQTCKNVILIFSINKSQAFQGYARMMSIPGSVERPPWQKSIHFETTGAFRVKWLVKSSTSYKHCGYLKNSFSVEDNKTVVSGRDGQEIEANCGASLIEIINKEVDKQLGKGHAYVKQERFEPMEY